MNKEMSLDVGVDIMGRVGMMKMKEIRGERDKGKEGELQKELDMVRREEKIGKGVLEFEVCENVGLWVMDKIEKYYGGKLKGQYGRV